MPPIASNRAYICAAISRNKIGADIFPVSKTAEAISFQVVFFNLAKTKANNAPIPADSVGVKKPNHIPPNTRKISAITPMDPINSDLVDSFFVTICCLVSPKYSGLIIAKTIKNRANIQAKIIPGIIPATKSFPIEISAITPHTINKILGGISMPNEALPAIEPSATALL